MTPQVPLALATGWKIVASRDSPDNGTESMIKFNAQMDNLSDSGHECVL